MKTDTKDVSVKHLNNYIKLDVRIVVHEGTNTRFLKPLFIRKSYKVHV